MAELGNSVIRGSLRVINGIHGDLEGSATKIKATAGTGKYYLVGTLGQNATDANSIAYEDANVFIDNGILSASRLQGTLDSSYLGGKIDTVSRIDDGSIPWAKLANNTASGKQVTYDGSTLTINGNLNVTGTTTFTASNSLSISDAMIELSSRISYSTALTKVTGMYARAMDGASASGFIGLAPSSVFKSKTGYGNYATRNAAVFLPSATFDSGTNDITYAIDDLKEILTDLNVLPAISSSAVTADSDSDGNYLVRKDKTGTLYVGPISWHGSSKVGMLYANSASSTAANAAGANPYINFFEGQTFKSAVRLLGSGAASVASDSAGNVTISATDYHVQVTTDDSGTIYLSGPASIPTTNTANVGTTLKGSTGVYVTAKKLYSNYGVASTGDLSLESGSSNSILLKSNLKSDSNPTTYVENSTGYIYELGHRPFPATSFSAAPTANHYYLPMRGNGTAGLVKSVSYVSSADLPAAASQDNDTLYLVDFGTLDPLSSGTLATTADKMYWRMSNTGGSVISDVSQSGNVLTFTKRTKTDGTTNVTSSCPQFTVDLSGVLPHHLMTGSAALSTIADTSITSYAFSSMPSDFPVENHSTIYTERNVGTPYQLLVGDCSYYIWKKPLSGSSWTKMYSGYADHAAYVDKSLTFTGYSTGSYNGSSALSIAIPNNTNQLTNGAGFLTEVSHDGTLVNKGTASNLLGINLANQNTWTGTQILSGNSYIGVGTSNSRAVADDPYTLRYMDFTNRCGGISGAVIFSGAGDWLYGANLKSEFDIRASFSGSGSSSDAYSSTLSYTGGYLANLFDWNYNSGWHVMPSLVSSTTPAVIQIKSSSQMSYTDVQRLLITGHDLKDFSNNYSGTLNAYKIEVCTNYASDTWVTVVDRSGVEDKIGLGLMFSLQTGSFTACYGIRLTITACSVTGSGYSFIRITSIQLRDFRPDFTVPDSVGAVSKLGGAFLGNVSAPAFIGALNGNASTSTYPYGFSNRSGSQGWGSQIGTYVTDWDDSTGGSIAFRRDNPSAGQLSEIIDGRYYQNEGQYEVLDTGTAQTISGQKSFTNLHYLKCYSSGSSTEPGAPINIMGGMSDYREGIRFHSFGSWSDLILCGDDNTADNGTSANSWFVGNNNGNFYITRDGSKSSTSAYLSCVGNCWNIYGSGNVLALNGKQVFDVGDSWLRINQALSFSSGVYFGSNIVRTDGVLQVGPDGSSFNANSSNVSTNNEFRSNYASGTWINGVKNACLTTGYTSYGAVFNAATQGGRISLSTFPETNNNVYLGYATTAQITAGTNSYNNEIHWDAANNILYLSKASLDNQLISTVATGTAPFSITSTTGVTNLNSDYVDGYHAQETFAVSTIPVRTSTGCLYATPRFIIRDDSIEQYASASDDAGVSINYYGYQSGSSYFRTFKVWNGKSDLVMFVDGKTKATNLYGQMVSTVATGTSPLSVASTTLVTNLNSDLLDGFHVQEQNNLGKAWGVVPTVKSDGVMEVGHYVDFHNSSADGIDFAVRLQTNGQSTGISVTLPSVSGTIMVKEDASSYPEIIDLTTVS